MPRGQLGRHRTYLPIVIARQREEFIVGRCGVRRSKVEYRSRMLISSTRMEALSGQQAVCVMRSSGVARCSRECT